VLQISDGGEYLSTFFRVGDEIIGYATADELIDRIRFYLANDEERRRIARNGYRRVMADHRIRRRLHEAGALIERGMGAA
jgi:spore maturation protein CgeB